MFILCASLMSLFQASVHSSVISQGEANRATSQTPAPLAPQVQQPGVSQQPDSQNAFHFLPPTQNYNLAPPAGSPMFIPMQQPVVGHGEEVKISRETRRIEPILKLFCCSIPQILPPHTYFPLLSSHQMNRLVRNVFHEPSCSMDCSIFHHRGGCGVLQHVSTGSRLFSPHVCCQNVH